MSLTDAQKEELLAAQQEHVDDVCDAIAMSQGVAGKKIAELEISMRRPASAERAVEVRLYQHYVAQREVLAAIAGTPYFCRCDVVTDAHDDVTTMYFGKQSYSDAKVYSWVVPAAALRFASIGPASYRTVDGSERNVQMYRKDQYMITDRKISFFATESVGSPRAIVFQEHLTRKKSGFILPEIVEQMEKAQDDVIRAHWFGPLLIGGPAGSGKTTLALHRVAYLLQAPELSEKFPQDETIVFVHDGASKAYFAGLFPELGLTGVKITTFHEWAMEMLGITRADGGISRVGMFVFRFGADEHERDTYELLKSGVLKNLEELKNYFGELGKKSAGDVWAILEWCYKNIEDPLFKKLFTRQRLVRSMDRFDLVLLLHMQRHSEGRIAKDVLYYDTSRTGDLVRKVSRVGVSYRLVVVDEMQNWLSEELDIVRGCLDKETEAVMFVGDVRQKTRIGSIAHIDNVGIAIADDRRVVLEKVYRNTKQIVEYCVRRGYDVRVLAGLAEGPEVSEFVADDAQGVVEVCKTAYERIEPGQTLGVITFSPERREECMTLTEMGGVHVVTVHEAQGLEFDAVVVVEESGERSFDGVGGVELQRVARDLAYVAFTRAMRELTVVKIK
jgi:RecA/RadA recombinase